jgi:hypothetical protein
MISDTATFPSRLFRYSEMAHAQQWITEGIVALGRAESYLRTELLPAQQDDERQRVFRPDMRRVTMYAGGPGDVPRPLRNVYDLRMTYRLPGYYLLCLSLNQNPKMLIEWPGYACIRINDPTAFFHRLDAAMTKQLPDYGFLTGPVTYLAENNFPKRPSVTELIFTKFKRYAYQEEYRLALLLEKDPNPADRHLLRLGPLDDLCAII